MGNEKPTANVLAYGKKEELPVRTPLRAGRLSLFYEYGFIRYIKVGDKEVLRMVNHAVRNRNWDTVPLTITEENITHRADSFRVDYRAEAQQDDVRFEWQCRIEGSSENTLFFNIEGEALTDFARNRIGFTILHPVKECAGREVVITHSDGTREVSRFPQQISPHQPFRDIRAMEWEIVGLGWARLDFSGDVFETEDQRNWIDDSYKTYCTPLELPFPVALNKGDRVRQSVRLSFREITSPVGPGQGNVPLTFEVDPRPRQLPAIGVGQSSTARGFTDRELKLLADVPFDHYLVDVKFYEADWPDKWERAVAEATQLGIPMELSLFFDQTALELSQWSSLLKTEPPAVAMINVFSRAAHVTQQQTIDRVVPVLRSWWPKTPIGVGTNAFFTELNRDRVSSPRSDFLVYSINPQVHAFDNGSLAETLGAIPYTADTARSFSAGQPIHISPITFKMRWNPNATAEEVTAVGQMPAAVDVRQMSLFGASWVLGCINSLVKCDIKAASFFETIGLKGIMQSSQPEFQEQFATPPQVVYPMYFIFRAILRCKSFEFFPLFPSDPVSFSGLVFREGPGKEQELLLGNLTADTLEVQLPESLFNRRGRLFSLENIFELMQSPEKTISMNGDKYGQTIGLPPFGILWLK